MPRRQTAVLRNLDDPLKILNVISLRSCGLVLVFFSALHAVETLFGLLTLLFGIWAFVVEVLAAAVAIAVLAAAERADDEHFVPAAIRYLFSRPWAFVYSGGISRRGAEPVAQGVTLGLGHR